jgi:arylformamidase
MSAVYRGMDQAELDCAYNNQAVAQDFAGLVARWRAQSAATAQASHARLDMAYGSQARQRVDFFPARRLNAPLLVFIHGGYWQGGEKRSVGFLAAGPLVRGFSVAIVEYTVAPEGRLDGMVEEVRSSIAWLRAKSNDLSFDAERIVLAGHSAGAQLLCNVLQEPGVVGGIAISGLYDLEPIRMSYLNAKLALTPADVKRFSPIRHPPPSNERLVVAVGANELPELVRQSREFADKAGVKCLSLEGHDHFSILDELASESGQLCTLLDAF